jgi:4-hydroxyphenylacetate 3-monooxygenase
LDRVTATTQQPPDTTTDNLMTSSEYVESLKDGRQVYLYGERVTDVTTHPAFRNATRSIARLYDTLHDPAQRDLLTTVDEYGIRTHKFFKPSRTPQELLEARDAIAAWARLSYGFMGRTPDYKAAFMASLGANPEFYAPYDTNALNWYKKFASRALFLNHVLVNPPVDRHKPIHEVADVFIHLVKERDDGIIVSGAKMLATGSAITHATFVAQNSSANLEKGKAEDFALVFIADMDTPGSKLICRNSYEDKARSPFDNPLSSRFDENDAVLLFDNAFIPWENVLVYRDVERANTFYRGSGFFSRYNLQSGTRLGVKLDFMSGLFAKGIAANGTDEFRGARRRDRLAQSHLGADLPAVRRPAARPWRLCHPQNGECRHPPPFLARVLDGDPFDLRDVPRRRADCRTVQLQGLAQCRSPPADRPLLPRL